MQIPTEISNQSSSSMNTLPPLSLYIHIPWCIRKCPYCDFNSHTSPEDIPETAYISSLIEDLKQDLAWVQERKLKSIFIGGGTPSLLSANAYKNLFKQLKNELAFASETEITLEANPGTFEQDRFKGFYDAGINRLSLGVQSFSDIFLKNLGRVHNGSDAQHAIESALTIGFNAINVDLMYGLSEQTPEDAENDLNIALKFSLPHLSWYQLNIEPNTYFYRYPPPLPSDDTIIDIENMGRTLLNTSGLDRYEISAYSKPGFDCLHNRNYWEFGDYLGIGAGAHSKLTMKNPHKIFRFQKHMLPKNYMSADKNYRSKQQEVSHSELPFEFMLNAFRLRDGFSRNLFSDRTGLEINKISSALEKALMMDLIKIDNEWIKPTAQGYQFYNDLVSLFI